MKTIVAAALAALRVGVTQAQPARPPAPAAG